MKKICIYKECGRKHCANGYCKPHNNHLLRYGEARRLRPDFNEFIDMGNYYKIVIYDRHRKPIDIEVLLSKCDYEKCKNKNWQYNGDYIKEATSKYTLYLHRYIQDFIPNGLVIDHINRNKLDNRRENLRIVTRSENNRNK
jgi:hypothetical protein